MKTKGILHSARKWWHALGHFGRLGKAATNRSFLIRERKKLLMRLGENTLHWMEGQKSPPHELSRLAEQVKKIDSLLARSDYGGEDGVDFSPGDSTARRRHTTPPSKARPSPK